MPRYTITKIYKNSWGQKLRFYAFCKCVSSYWSCVPVGTLTYPSPSFVKIKKNHRWWFFKILIWRMVRDSNPRTSCPVSGFQDRRIRPLCQPSKTFLRSPFKISSRFGLLKQSQFIFYHDKSQIIFQKYNKITPIQALF